MSARLSLTVAERSYLHPNKRLLLASPLRAPATVSCRRTKAATQKYEQPLVRDGFEDERVIGRDSDRLTDNFAVTSLSSAKSHQGCGQASSKPLFGTETWTALDARVQTSICGSSPQRKKPRRYTGSALGRNHFPGDDAFVR
jgi:hypothetical protein